MTFYNIISTDRKIRRAAAAIVPDAAAAIEIKYKNGTESEYG